MCKSAATTTSEDEKENVESITMALSTRVLLSMIGLVLQLKVSGKSVCEQKVTNSDLTRYLIWKFE